MATFRFLHCADLHIDSPLRGLDSTDPDAPADRIRGATREAFANLVDYALAQQVAFVLAAGDLYDGDWTDWRTGQFLMAQVGRLSRAGIPFIAIRGNHDAENIITRRLTLPEPARLLRANRPETIHLPDLDVCIHGQSFRSREVTENLAKDYPAPIAGRLNIGLLHTSVNGREGHASYAPCTLDQLRDHAYDYWALGHVHTREVLHRDPWIIFPGNTQGRHVRETAAKGATLVTVRDGAITGAEPVIFDTIRWAQLEVDLTDADTEERALSLARARMTEAVQAAEGKLLAARIILHGACAAHDLLSRDHGATSEKIRAEAMALAGAEAIWIESVAGRTTSPRTAAEPPGLLVNAVHEADPALLEETVAKYCREMLDRASGLREHLPEDHPAIQLARNGALPEALIERARALLLARLSDA